MFPFTETLIKIFKILAVNPVLDFIEANKVNIHLESGAPIFECDSGSIHVPIPRIETVYNDYKSSSRDSVFDFEKLSKLITALGVKDNIVRLNHVGMCYKVQSQVDERVSLINEIKLTDLNLYEEPSNDKGLWLFVGNTVIWKQPLLELLPVEDISDEWIDYWLPHFQIDIDTNWSSAEIEKMVESIYLGEVKPYRVTVIDGVVYCVRVRLGIISGININLDIATNRRDVEYLRTNILRRLN